MSVAACQPVDDPQGGSAEAQQMEQGAEYVEPDGFRIEKVACNPNTSCFYGMVVTCWPIPNACSNTTL